MIFASSRPEFVNQPASGLAIDINGLSKTYQGSCGKPPHLALDALDLHVPVGCIFGLLGPNGAGKSSLINILAGAVVKTAGTVTVWGTDIDQNPLQARQYRHRAAGIKCRCFFYATPDH